MLLSRLWCLGEECELRRWWECLLLGDGVLLRGEGDLLLGEGDLLLGVTDRRRRRPLVALEGVAALLSPS